MMLSRENSLKPVKMPTWRWAPFLDDVVKSFDSLDPEPYPLEKQFLEKVDISGSKLKPLKITTSTWACSTTKLRQVRAACVDAGKAASVLNFVISPLNIYELPFFGADFVTLPSGHLLALDLQPAIKNDPQHTQFVWDRLIPLFESWRVHFPVGGPIPEEAKSFFSPGFLWTRFPVNPEGDKLINEVLRPAFNEYLKLYLDLVKKAERVSPDRSIKLLNGQHAYINYRAEKDPARSMLSRFHGKEWTESYIKNALFDL